MKDDSLEAPCVEQNVGKLTDADKANALKIGGIVGIPAALIVLEAKLEADAIGATVSEVLADQAADVDALNGVDPDCDETDDSILAEIDELAEAGYPAAA